MKTRSVEVAFFFLSLLTLSSGRTINNSERRKRLRQQTRNTSSGKGASFYDANVEEIAVSISTDGTSPSPSEPYMPSAKGKKNEKKSDDNESARGSTKKEASHSHTSHSVSVNTESIFSEGKGGGKGREEANSEDEEEHHSDTNDAADSDDENSSTSGKKSKKDSKKSKKSKKIKSSSSADSSKKSKKYSKKSKKHKDSDDKSPEDDLDVPSPSQSPSVMPASSLFPSKSPERGNKTSAPTTNESESDIPSEGPVASPTSSEVDDGPTRAPSTGIPTVTQAPAGSRTALPTRAPTTSATDLPSIKPTTLRTASPTRTSGLMPTAAPTTTQTSPPREVTENPTVAPSTIESQAPSGYPSNTPTIATTILPSAAPNSVATDSLQPSFAPSGASTQEKTSAPTGTVSLDLPSVVPTINSPGNETVAPTTDSTASSPPSVVPTTNDSTPTNRTAAPTTSSTASDAPSAVPINASSPNPVLSDAPSAVPSLVTPSNQTNSAAPTATTTQNVVEGSFETALNLDEVPERYRQIFIDAAAKWDSVIVGDLEDYVVREAELSIPDLRCDPASIPQVVDDVYICASFPEIDSVGGILGSAGPSFARFGDFVQTSVGYMQFDLADVEILEQKGQLAGTILHEMAHVYGIGTLWSENQLTEDSDSCPYKYDSRASEEYRALSGCDGAVPIETDGAEGTKCLHWDEDCFQSELMTGVNTGDLELSRISIAALEDLGYQVDYSQATPFSTDLLSPSCVCNAENTRSLKDQVTRVQRPSAASQEARQNAIEYGRAKLKSARSANVISRDPNRIYLEDKMTVVLYWDDDRIQSVLVTDRS